MSLFRERKGYGKEPADPLGGIDPAPGSYALPQEKQPSRRKKMRDIIRIEEIEKALNSGDREDIDAAKVASYFIPRRRAKMFGAALLRLNKLYLLLLGLLLLLMLLFILSFSQEKMGNFTINLNRLELYRKGIAISADAGFTEATARLRANMVEDATNITVSDLPEDLDDIDGDHNGDNYMAYTYYVRNAGKEDTHYYATVNLDAASKGAEAAVRVAVWHNGKRTIYAAPAADGGPEEGCISFETETLVCTYEEENFLVGNVDKYTIVIWMEGEDPECTDAIVGGSVQFSMNIDADISDESSLLVKFVRDVRDFLTGNQSIGSSSSDDVPDYYKNNEVTWYTRRNQ
jgi:hypothetical protein